MCLLPLTSCSRRKHMCMRIKRALFVKSRKSPLPPPPLITCRLPLKTPSPHPQNHLKAKAKRLKLYLSFLLCLNVTTLTTSYHVLSLQSFLVKTTSPSYWRSLVIAPTRAILGGCFSNSNFSSFSEMENRVREDLWQLHKHHLLPGLLLYMLNIPYP